MSKSRIVITLLLTGLICFVGAYTFNITWAEPQVDRVLIEKIMVTLVMVLSGVITVSIGIVTTIEAQEWRSLKFLYVFTPTYLLICIAGGSLPPIPAELQSPIALFLLLISLIFLCLVTAGYYVNGKVESVQNNSQSKFSHVTDREKEWMRWGR